MNFQESVIHIDYARYSYDYWYPRLFVIYSKKLGALGTCLLKIGQFDGHIHVFIGLANEPELGQSMCSSPIESGVELQRDSTK